MFEKIQKLKLGKLDANQLLQSISNDSGPLISIKRKEDQEKTDETLITQKSPTNIKKKANQTLNPIRERPNIEQQARQREFASTLKGQSKLMKGKGGRNSQVALQKIDHNKQKDPEQIKAKL